MPELEQVARAFLTALSRAMSACGLYEGGHPQRERAVDALFLAFSDLQTMTGTPSFTFLDGEVALDGHTLASLRGWEWGSRLAGIGMERIEIGETVCRDDLVRLIEFTNLRLQGLADDVALPGTIRFGPVAAMGPEAGTAASREWRCAPSYIGLDAEVDLLCETFHEARENATVHVAEVTAVVESLVAAMASGEELLMPLLRLKAHDQYTVTHSINVAVLSMALAEYLGLPAEDVRLIGIGGVLHDIGKTKLPQEVLTKPGKLSDAEFALMRSHPEEGARMILKSSQAMELAAIMAYEHHVRYDGGGYPTFRFQRRCHVASNLLHVCDVYDALATNRPYRDGWESSRILGYLSEGAGTEFAPALVRAFVKMMSEMGDRVRLLGGEEQRPPAEALPTPG